ncbi:MAG: ArsR family transcriptional regulator [Neptuniibacter sp.]
MPFAKFEEEDRRLVILRHLAEDQDYTVNSSILQSAIAVWGHKVSRDRLHADIAWLKEQGLVTYEEVSSVYVAKITQRGLDVAEGTASVPGVKRPGPGA